MRAYEIDLINYCFRIVSNHYAQPFDLNDKKPFFDQYSQLSIEKLITVNTPEELVENLRDTEYYRPLKRVQDSTNATLFDYDLALNLYYYTTLWKEQKKILKKEDLALFKRDCGVKIDLLNIQWIYRAKRYYKMSSAEIISLLIPIHYRISKEMILGLIEAGSRDDFYKILTRTPYYRPNISAQEYTLEKLYTDYLSHVYMTDRSKRPYSFATINTYLFLKEEEINKLTTALECIRYGLTPGETLAYIGGRT
jgi:V/A-type H+-transporting ATPase subunit C